MSDNAAQDAEDVRVCAFCGATDNEPYRWSEAVQAWFCEDSDPDLDDAVGPEHSDGGEHA